MTDNEIIDFYKKAEDRDKPVDSSEKQIESLKPLVSEEVTVTVPENSDPFDKFLFNLAEKLKEEKKITEQQQQQFNERVVQPTTSTDDPFAKFLESFAGLVKQDENVNKEENIKNATINFINNLKEDDFFDKDTPKIAVKEKQIKSKSKKYLPPKFVKKITSKENQHSVIEQFTKTETVQSSQTNQPDNPYLKELQVIDKNKTKTEEKVSGLSDIKKIIAQQIQEQLSRYPNLSFSGGGGGTNAVQYAKGGTMDGDLNVTGKYLSGGVDISTLFSSGGGVVSGIPDRLIADSETLRLYPDGTIDFPNDTIRPPDETILTLESEAPLLSSYTRIALSPYAFFAYDNEGNSITFDKVDNNIVLTSQDKYEWTFDNKGILQGPHNTLTVNGLSSLGKILSGDKDLFEIFTLTATDNSNIVTLVTYNSANWNTAYYTATSYQAVSSNFATNTLLNTLTGQLVTSIANITATLLPTTVYQSASGNWQETYTTVRSNSASWGTGSTETFETVSKNLKSYPYTVNYNGSLLTSISYNLPDNKQITKIFSYVNNNLTTVTLSGDLPVGISTVKTLEYSINNALTGATYQ